MIPGLENIKDCDIKVVPFSLSTNKKEYNDMLSIWEACRDACRGQQAIKEKGEVYLPKLNGQDSDDYKAYLKRSQWYGATNRTREAYEGMIFRKFPVFSYYKNGKEDPSLKDKGDKFFNRVTYDSKDKNECIQEVMDEVIKVDKVGLLIDAPNLVDADGKIPYISKYDMEKNDIKPVVSMYRAEQIKNWNWIVTNGKLVPYMYVLQEEQEDYTEESINPVKVPCYRVLYLENADGPVENRRYKQIIFRDEYDDKKKWIGSKVMDIIYPRMGDEYMTEIPFYIITSEGIEIKQNKPSIIYDLVETNLGHYRNSADLENELHWVGIKTLYLPGWNRARNGDPVMGGCMTGPIDSKPFLIEASSDSGISEEMVKKESRMAVLGAERIAQQGRYIASAQTSETGAVTESSMLSNLSKSVAKSCAKVFSEQLRWAGEDYSVEITLNTDYYQDDITGTELVQWLNALQTGLISFDTYYFNLEKKEAFKPGWTKEKEKEAILDSSMELMGMQGTSEIEELRSMIQELSAKVNGSEVDDTDEEPEEIEEVKE